MSNEPRLAKLQTELVNRYVNMPVSYWNDGYTTSKDTGVRWITGKILKVI